MAGHVVKRVLSWAAPLPLLTAFGCLPPTAPPTGAAPDSTADPGDTGDGSAGSTDPTPATDTADPTDPSGPSPTAGDDGTTGPSDDTAGGSDGGTTVDPSIIWLLDAETGALQAEDMAHDGARAQLPCSDRPEAYTVSDGYPVHTGSFSLRVRTDRAWLEGDPNCNTAAVQFTQGSVVQIVDGEEYWHGWAVYVPDNPGGGWQSTRWATTGPENRSLRLRLGSDLSWQVTGSQFASYEPYDLTVAPQTSNFGPQGGDVWHEFVAHFVVTTDDDAGFFQLWHRLQGDQDWAMVWDATGRTANLDAPFPFEIRMGLHTGHNWPGSAGGSKVLYFDEIRFGGADSGFDAVAPGSGLAPP